MADLDITQDANLTSVTTPGLTDRLVVIQGTLKDMSLSKLLELVYPVGSIYISVTSTNPGTLFGGTWSAFGAGRALVGIDAGQTEFDTVEETGGSKTHTLTSSEMPAHVHQQQVMTNSGVAAGVYGATPNVNGSAPLAAGFDTQSTGGGGAHNNLQPYIVVYMWKRTA